MVLDKIGQVATQNCHLVKKKLIIVGVSGGADSLCLLEALSSLGYPLVVAYFNHQLREEAKADAQFVEAVAARAHLPFVLGSGSVAEFSTNQGLSIEQAARELRYRFLFDQARQFSAQAVAVGHTADDQVETVLMHLVRGCGLSGLKGMPFYTKQHGWDCDFALVRPLLTIWHEETLSFCSQRNRMPVYDITNSDTTYLRNRIRHELIPLLEGYNPRIREAVLRTAQIITNDYEVLSREVDRSWGQCLIDEGPGYVTLNRQGVLNVNRSIQRGIFRKAIEWISPSLSDVELETIERALDFTAVAGQTGRIDLINGLLMVREGSMIHFLEKGCKILPDLWPQMKKGTSFNMDFPGVVQLNSNVSLQGDLVPTNSVRELSGAIYKNNDPFQAWLDADLLRSPLEVRTRKPGDVFQPLGLEGKKQKISDFMINIKCPSRAREGWPIVCSGGQIVWVPGYRLAHFTRVTENTQRVLHLKLDFKRFEPD